MNIVLVIFDSLRKDCIGTYGSPPWGQVHTPNLDAFAQDALTFTRVWPESLPTLSARRAIYTGQRVYPFFNSLYRLKGDFAGGPGWGPIPEELDTTAELLQDTGEYRTALISDLYHMFKPAKNFWRGFDQWTFLRGKEKDTYRSGPEPTQEEIDFWLAPELQVGGEVDYITQALKNMHGREQEEDYFCPRVMMEAARWLEQNRDAQQFFLLVESFDPHEPWFVPPYYRRMYDTGSGREQVTSPYLEVDQVAPDLLHRAQANYSGVVTMCDRWFGHFYETMRVLGLLEDTVVIVTSDHGHSLGDGNFFGKRGYPSHPSVFDVPLFIRHPDGRGAGQRSDLFLQHTDISAQILEFAGIEAANPLSGQPFWEAAAGNGKNAPRDHVTVAWDSAVTVIDDRWWMSCQIDGRGAFLHDRSAEDPFMENVADANPETAQRLFCEAVDDAGGVFPDYLQEWAARRPAAPGASSASAKRS